MNSKKSITKNYIYNLIYQIFAIVVPLITTPYLSRVLGAENIGIYSYTLSVTTYFILFGSLGIAMYAQREIAYVQDDKNKRSKVFFEILLIKIITLSISMIIFYITFGMQGEYSIYYKIFLLEIIANIIDISWFFQGMEEFKKTVMRNMLVKLISIILIFVLVKSSNDLTMYIWIYVLSTFFGNLTLWMYLPKYICKIKMKQLELRRHVKPVLTLFVPQIASQIYTVLDKTMLGSMISDKSETGFYEQAQKIVKILLTIVTALGTVMLPRMSSIFAKNDKEQIKKYLDNSFNFVFLLGFPIMLGISIIANRFVPIFFGPGYEEVITIIRVISPIVIFIGLSNVIGVQYLLPTKRQKMYTISVIVGACVNLVINFLLIPNFKAIGASIGTVIAELMVLVVQIYLTRKEIKFTEILKRTKNYIIAVIIMCIPCAIVDKFVTNSFLAIGMQICLGGAVYLSILMILKDYYLYDILNKIRNIYISKLRSR